MSCPPVIEGPVLRQQQHHHRQQRQQARSRNGAVTAEGGGQCQHSQLQHHRCVADCMMSSSVAPQPQLQQLWSFKKGSLPHTPSAIAQRTPASSAMLWLAQPPCATRHFIRGDQSCVPGHGHPPPPTPHHTTSHLVGSPGRTHPPTHPIHQLLAP